jgi:predicted kinase
VRALARLRDAGLVRNVGLSNVNRRQLDEALELAPIAVVEIALGPHDDTAIRGGVVARCAELGIGVLAHSPLGGPARAPLLSRDRALADVARRRGVGVGEVVLAALVDLHPCVVPIPGATRAETASACARAAQITLDDEDRATLEGRFGWRGRLAPRPARRTPGAGEAVLLMGIQGSGKSTEVARWTERGYERLNRDARGGSMHGLHALLEERLAKGARVVLDNTYVTRAHRHGAIEAARKAGAEVHGVWLETKIGDAQVNVVVRMLAAHGRLLEPHEMARAKDPTALPPHALFRTVRETEPPSLDEGFATLETLPFVRRHDGRGRRARLVALEAALDARGAVRAALLGVEEGTLVFGWRPEADVDWAFRARAALAGKAHLAWCPHPAGPPRCWCRPPLPGLALAFAATHGIDLARSVVVGTGPHHQTLARALGAAYEAAP